MTSLYLFLSRFAANCGTGSFLGFPHWYKYLTSENITLEPEFGGTSSCVVHFQGLSDIWLVAAAVIEILLRLAVLIAVIMIIVGGVTYITSRGEPDKMSKALKTIIGALVGLVIAIAATAIISFLAGKFGG